LKKKFRVELGEKCGLEKSVNVFAENLSESKYGGVQMNTTVQLLFKVIKPLFL